MLLRELLNNSKYIIHKQFFHSRHLSSNEVRKRFLDFFVEEHSHTFIRSSPVVPLHDHSLAFVNAGMNQFKEVFLNKTTPPCLTAANTQKCIRVGGKHNDLKDVGFDTYHHTFFEMLGNWSFGNYFKQEACELAWKLLTSPPYSIDPRRLYVTYFSGCSRLGLPPDLETKEIWMSLGVEPTRILGFGAADNFWEMGPTGPCGACTEIHVDHLGSREAADRVNRGHADLTELWNIVFIQYNRNADGSLSSLPHHHVDTGMGFERLVAFLQNKSSNYDTDLFLPLFNSISKVAKAAPFRGKFGVQDEGGVDTAYRILADHSRMVTVAVADNMFPDTNHKLRRVLRKALLVAEDSFKMKNPAKLVKEVCNCVAEILSPTYPEIGINLNKVHLVVDHEWEVLQVVRGGAAATWRSVVQQDSRVAQLSDCMAPGLTAAYRELSSLPAHSPVAGDLAFRLYDTHGLPPDLIEELSQALGLEFDENAFNATLVEAKARTLQSAKPLENAVVSNSCLERLKQTIPPTDDTAKYNYCYSVKDGYVFPKVDSVVQAVVRGGEVVSEARVGERVGLVVDRTCLYHAAGGQAADRGLLEGEGWTMDCDTLLSCGEYLVHFGTLRGTEEVKVASGCPVSVWVETARRLAHMRSHTATHCLNAELHRMFVATHQTGSSVTEDHLTFDFATYGQHFNKEHVMELERKVQEVIKSRLPVRRTTVSSNELTLLDNVTLLPGETYPSEGIHLIQIESDHFVSKEACCGTHVLNTADIQDFCVSSVKSQGSGVKSLMAVTGATVQQVRQDGQAVLRDVAAVREDISTAASDNNTKLEELESSLQSMKRQTTELLIPYADRVEALSQLESAAKSLKESARVTLRQTVEKEIKEVLKSIAADTGCQFLVYCLQTTSQLDSIPLQKVTRMCPLHLPVLIFAYAEGQLKARCCVPQARVSHNANAETWMKPVVDVVGGSGGPPRGQDPRLVFNLKPIHIPPSDVDRIVKLALTEANQMAIKLFND